MYLIKIPWTISLKRDSNRSQRNKQNPPLSRSLVKLLKSSDFEVKIIFDFFFFSCLLRCPCPFNCCASPWMSQAASSGNNSLHLHYASSRGSLWVKQLSLAKGLNWCYIPLLHWFIFFLSFFNVIMRIFSTQSWRILKLFIDLRVYHMHGLPPWAGKKAGSSERPNGKIAFLSTPAWELWNPYLIKAQGEFWCSHWGWSHD